MARNQSNSYASFTPGNYFNPGTTGITPGNYWGAGTAGLFQNPQYGLDTSTGKRDAKKVANALIANPFGGAEGSNQFPGTPGFDVAAPFDTAPYKELISELDKKTFLSNFKEQLLGLGSGLAFSAASLPLVERLRNLDYQLGLSADIQSPTRQAARDASRQQQFATASDAVSDRLRALAAVRQGASSGVNVGV